MICSHQEAAFNMWEMYYFYITNYLESINNGFILLYSAAVDPVTSLLTIKAHMCSCDITVTWLHVTDAAVGSSRGATPT